MAARSPSTAPTRVTRAGAVLARGFVVVSGVLVALLVLVTTASAYWSAPGSGDGSGTTGTLAAPIGVTVPANSLSGVAVAWTASTGSPTPTGYYVTRTSGGTTVAACGSSASSLVTGTSCTDSGVPNGTYTYKVVAAYRSWTAASAPSSSVSVWTPTKVAFTGQPTNTVAGVGIVPAVAVTVQTAAGLTVPLSGRSVTVAIGTNPGGGTLSGTATATTDATGVATFAGLSIDKAAAGYTLTAASSGLAPATSGTFTISAATADRFVITSAAVSGTASTSATLGPITVQRQDPLGNPATPASAVTVTLTSNSTGTKFFSATSGGPSTTTVTIPTNSASVNFYYADNKAGGPTITVSGALTGTTQIETILAAAPSTFLITSTAVSGAASASATLGPITAAIQDSFGNTAIAPAGGTSGTLSSNTTGTAVFAATSVGSTTTTVTIPAGFSSATFYYGDTKAASPTVKISGLTTDATQAETITAAAAATIAFVQQPTNTAASSTMSPVTVQIKDTFGNPATGNVVVAIARNGSLLGLGSLAGTKTRTANAAGVATFNDLSVGVLGLGSGYTLVATTSALTATSTAFSITLL